MTRIQEALLDGYRAVTWPWRARFRQVRARVGMSPVMVLFYHRVADYDVTPWTITNDDFRRHLDWLQENLELVSLEEAQRRIATRFNEHPCVTITFDDGYADNCDHAIGELIERQIPATYFVTLDNILTGLPFPHDADLEIDARPNTLDQIRDMAKSGLIEIGGHTRSHLDCGKIKDLLELKDEVIYSIDALEYLLDRPINYFAFPFGQHKNINDTAINLLRERGIRGFCSAYGGYNFPGDDPYHIQRIHGDSELSRLKNWLTIDPRKLTGVKRYQPRYNMPLAAAGDKK